MVQIEEHVIEHLEFCWVNVLRLPPGWWTSPLSSGSGSSPRQAVVTRLATLEPCSGSSPADAALSLSGRVSSVAVGASPLEIQMLWEEKQNLISIRQQWRVSFTWCLATKTWRFTAAVVADMVWYWTGATILIETLRTPPTVSWPLLWWSPGRHARAGTDWWRMFAVAVPIPHPVLWSSSVEERVLIGYTWSSPLIGCHIGSSSLIGCCVGSSSLIG